MDIHDIAMAANIAAKGGGTSDYTDLDNKPSINGEELSGNMTAAQLGLVGLDSGGKVPINQLPPAAVERMTVVENDTARFALTTDRVQNGDTVKVTATNKMYMVVDDTNLGTEAGYSVYVAGRAAEAVADEDGNNIKESLASKVDKVTGKSLSTNDYTTADKEKLNGIETQANKTVVDDALSSSSENPVQNKVINAALANKADNYDLYALSDSVSVLTSELNTKADISDLTDLADNVSDISNRLDFIEERLDHETIIYGWHVDPDESDPADAITYLKDAVGMTPAAMGASTFSYGSWDNAFFMPKPCMLKFDGTVDYYLDPNDYSNKVDGTASDVADPTYEGNAMMEWPLIWWKYEPGTKEGEGYFFCSNRKVDDSYKCWCNIDSKNQIIDHFYTAIYNGTGTDKLRSISDVQLTPANGNGNTSGTTELSRALANNTTEDVEWYIDVWADRMLINGLLILIGKSLDSQGVFGRGICEGEQTSKEAYVTGTLDDKGLFYGNISGSSTAVKVFGMENWWGLVWRRTAGLVGLNGGTTAVKMTYGTADGTTAEGYNTTGNGYYIDTNIRVNAGYVSKMRFNTLGFYLPMTTGASTTTKWCDYWYPINYILTYALVGGSSRNGDDSGGSYFALDTLVSNASLYSSAAPSCKPCKKG